MARIVRSTRARADLIEIWNYTENHSGEIRADRLLRLLDQKCVMLARTPQMGRMRHDLLPDLRSFAAGSYLIFYRQIDDGIEVVRVLHGARDISALFGD